MATTVPEIMKIQNKSIQPIGKMRKYLLYNVVLLLEAVLVDICLNTTNTCNYIEYSMTRYASSV